MRAFDGLSGGPIVCSSVSFAEIICLDTVRDTATEFPVYFVQVAGQQDHTTNDTCPWRGLDYIFNTAEEEFGVQPHGWCVVSFVESELGSIFTENYFGFFCHNPLGR